MRIYARFRPGYVRLVILSEVAHLTHVVPRAAGNERHIGRHWLKRRSTVRIELPLSVVATRFIAVRIIGGHKISLIFVNRSVDFAFACPRLVAMRISRGILIGIHCA